MTGGSEREKGGKNERKNFELENQEIMEKGENIHQETKLM